MTKILIFRNQGIGDCLLITPAIRAIRELHPQAHIAVFVGNWSKVALEGNPHIDEIISYPDEWIQGKKPFRILSLIHRLRRKNFQRVYIFHSHNMLHLLVLLAGIPERYGFSFRGTGKLLTKSTEWQPNTDRYIADNYLDIPRLAGYRGNDLSLDFFLCEEEDRLKALLEANNLLPGKYYVISPGGGINPRQNVFEKRWGRDKFAELTMRLSTGFGEKCVLTGAPGEKELCDYIAVKTKDNIINLCGKIPFRVSAALVKYSRALVCNDSSLMHIAVAFKVPSVSIFGPSNHRSLLPESNINRYVISEVDCSPCYCNEIFPGCDRDLLCMKEIKVERVIEVLKELELVKSTTS